LLQTAQENVDKKYVTADSVLVSIQGGTPMRKFGHISKRLISFLLAFI